MNGMKPGPVRRLLLWGVAAVLAWAGLVKVADPDQFIRDLHGYRLFPHALVLVLAYWVPWLELAAAAGLAWDRFRRGGLVCAMALFLSFLIVLYTAVVRGIDVSCGCFGRASAGVDSHAAFFRALGLWLLTYGLFLVELRTGRDGGATGEPGLEGAGKKPRGAGVKE